MASDPLAWIDAEAAERVAKNLRRSLVALDAGEAGAPELDGRPLLNFASNDYLGLAVDPRVVEAATRAASRFGWGAGASPLVSGWRRPHQDLAEALADFERTEAVALFSTGYAANVGTIAAVVGKEDGVYLDRLAHACLIDGARLSRATVGVFQHNDPEHLESLLSGDRGRFRRKLIVTEGVFSMDGDMAPLRELVEVAERFDAMLLVDEAHATGVFGDDGRGACSALGVSERVAIRSGTLSKALGSVGGFVAGSRRLIDHLINRARTLIYSTATPPAAAAAALASLAIVRAEPERAARVVEAGRRLRTDLAAAGFETPASVGPIVPVILGSAENALAVSKRLRDQGFFVPAIRPPTVPEGTARLRISLSAAHPPDRIDALLLAMRNARG